MKAKILLFWNLFNLYTSKKALSFLLLACFTASITVLGQTTSATYTTAGADTWVCPPGVTSITVECWGGGGAGGGATGNPAAGGGGAGGAYTKATLSVTPGTTYNLSIGAGGIGSTTAGPAGGNSWFNTSGTLLAIGGPGGGLATNGVGAIAPTTGNIGGTTNFYGGDGVTGASGSRGGGGGGSAGNAANGNDGINQTGGTAVTGGGAGGNGATTGANGSPGTDPGAGGGGARATSNTDRSGGSGADGQVIVTWVPGYLAQFISMNFGSATWCAGETRTVSVTIKNIGQATWTSSGPDVNIGLKWNTNGSSWADYYVRTDANNLAPGSTAVYNLTITASNNLGAGYTTPLANGTNNLTFDVVKEGDCWFGSNSGSCGPGNSVYTSPNITIINSVPAQPSVITGSANPCIGSSQTYSVTNVAGITYTWAFPSDWTITAGQGTNSVTVTVGATSGNVQVTPSNACGNGTASTLAVTVNILPVAAGTITGTATVCQGQNGVAYSVPAITNATGYVWTLPTGATIATGSNTNSITMNFNATAVSGNITVYGTSSCGNGTVSPNFAITVNTTPAASGTITGTATICQGQNGVAYSVAAITNATGYVWTLPTGATIASGANTRSITVNYSTTAVSGNITVYGTRALCNGTVSPNYAVTVNPLPIAAGTITGTASVCQSQNGVAYSVPAITNATGYVWTLPMGATIATGSNTNSITVNFNATAVSGNITVYGTNACGNGTVSPNFAVTVNTTPAAAGTITGTATVCQGQNGVAYSVVAIINATGYVWTLPTGATIASGANTRSITVNYNTTAISGNITVYGTTAFCNGTVSPNYAVTVNPLPVAAGTITGTASVCQSQNGVAYSVPAITNATGYIWTLPTGATIATGSNTRSITVNYSAIAVSGNITVYGTNACGNGIVSPNFAVTVNTKPAAAGTITGTATVCQGQNGVAYSVAAIAGATGYVWTLPTGATIATGSNTNSITVNYSTTAVSGNITVYGTNTCGNGTVSPNFAVTVNTTPAAAGAITGTATVCQGQNGVAYSVAAITNATGYVWTLPTGATIASGANTRSITVNYSTTAVSGNITVYGTRALCNGTVSPNYAVTVNPLPVAAGTITGSASACRGQNGVAYSVPAITNATGYVWTLPTGATIASGANTRSITVNFSITAVSGNITVYGTNACGSGASSLFLVNVSTLTPSQPSIITGSNSPCVGSSQTYFVTNVANVNYNWTFPSGWTQTGGGTTNSITVTVGASSGNIVITPSNGCGNGTPRLLAVTPANGVPAQPGPISGTDTACQNSTWNYSIPNVSGVTYTWAGPAGSLVTSGQGTNNVSIQFSTTSGNITIIPSNSCGIGPSQSQAIILQASAPPQPSIITGSVAPCQGSTQTYSVVNVPSVLYFWTVPSDWTITAGQNTNSITVTVGTATGNISVSGSNYCGWGNPRNLAVISMAAVPDQPILANGDITVCVGSDQYYTVNNILYTNYSWTIPGGWILISGQGTNQIHVTAGATSGNIVVTPSNACGGGTSLSIAVTVDLAIPAQPVTINGNINPCQASTQTYSVTNVAGVSYQWTLPADWTIVSGQGSNSINIIVGAISGDIDIIASNSCGSAVDQMLAIVVSPLPNQPGAISGSITICEGSTSLYSITQVSGVIYSWTVPTGWSITSGQGTNSISVIIGANSGNIQVTPVNGCGNGLPRLLYVTVNNKPPADAGPDKGICSGASINIGAPALPGNTYSWTSNPVGFTSSNSNPLVQPVTTTSYYLVETITATGCTNTDNVVVTVNQVISVTITPPSSNICTRGTTNIALASNITGTVFTWTVSLISGSGTTGFLNGGGNNIIQTINNASGATSIVEYSITATANVCTNTLNYTDVSVNPAPAVSSQTKTICSDIPTLLTLGASTNGISAVTYNITNINSNGLSAVAGNPVTGSGFSNSIIADDSWLNTTTTPVDVVYTVVPVGTSCSGSPFTVTITVKPKPEVTNSTPQLICSGTSTNINLSATITSTYSWSLGTITGGITGASAGSGVNINQVLNNPDHTSAGFVPYIVTPISTAGSCTGNAYTITVIIKPLPIITNPSTKSICSNDLGTDINLTASVASTFSWTIGTITGGISGASAGSGPTISQVLTNPSNTTTGTVQYIISATSSLGCSIAAPYTITVLVNPLPVVIANSSVNDVCPGIAFNLLSSSSIDYPPILMFENFNGGTNSWTKTNSSTGGTPANAAWTLRPDGYISNSQTFHSNDNSQFYVSDSYSQNGTVTSTTLTSPAISTIGYNTLTLDFYHYYSYNARTNEAAKVQVSTDGTIWTDIATYTSNQGSVNNFAHPSINLNAYIGNATLYIRFFYYLGSNRGKYWAIDNVTLSGTSSAPAPAISWNSNPAGYYSNVANPINVVQTVTSTYYATYTNTITGCSKTASKTVNCYPSPIHTILARYCAVPGHIQLRDSIIGGTGTYLWSTNETTQIIAIDIAGVYSVTVTNSYGCTSPDYIDASEELVVDGTFTNFNPSSLTFTTGYIQQQSYYNPSAPNPALTGLWPEGDYAVNVSAWYNPGTNSGYHPNFHGQDHTNNASGPRNFLMINGSTTDSPLKIIWQQTVAIMPNTDYYFSAWAMNLNPVSPAQLQFEVNGTLAGTIADLNVAPKPTSEGQVGLTNWVRFYSNPLWNSGSATTAQIRIVNLNTVAGGNDFGLDDISFGTLAPIPFTINPSTGGSICAGQTLVLNANISGGRSPINYTWTGPAGFISHLPNPTIPNATIANSGNYTLAVTDGYGCPPVIQTISAVVNPIPTASISGNAQVCQYGLQPNITFTGNAGTPPYTFTYKINNGADQFITTTSGNSKSIPVSTLIPGTYVYSLISVSDVTGCNQIQSGSATITVNSLPIVAISGDNPVCPGSLGIPYNATTGLTTYLWGIAGHGTIIGPTNTENIHVNAGINNNSSFVLTLNVTDSKGCSGSNTITIHTQDTTKPTLIIPPSPQDRNVGANTCSYIAIADEFDPTSFDDNCQVASVINSLNGTNSLAGYVFPLGITQVIWTVTDMVGNSTTDSINIRIMDDEPPIITCPQSQVVCANSLNSYINNTNLWNASATDNCSLDNLTYILSGATIGTGSTLNGVTFNEGITSVRWRAFDVSGNSSFCDITITVQTEPIISVQPQDKTVCPSTTQVIFSVTASQSPLPSYQWRKNGLNITNATGANYTINNPQLSNVGIYDVVITNTCGNITSSPANLIIPGPLSATIDTTYIYASSGYDPVPIVLNLAKSGGMAPYTYQWQLNNSDIPGAIGVSYDPPPLMVVGDYYYDCKVCDACGTTIATKRKKINIGAPLPIELGYFTANCVNGLVNLYWTTMTETNNEYFTLENSADTKKWMEIAKIKGAGNSNQILDYRYSDENPLGELSYYRLKQTDFDGKSETFSPVAVVCSSEKSKEITINPNPFKSELIIKYSNLDNGNAIIKVFDIMGNNVFYRNIEIPESNGTFNLDLQSLPIGVYFVEYSSGDFIYHQKVLKE